MKRGILILLSIIYFASFYAFAQEDRSPIVSQQFSNAWKFRAGEGTDSLWMAASYNDSRWQDVSSAKTLKEQEQSLQNGFGWYRKTIQLSDSLQYSAQAKGAVMLSLGKLAATDEVYFNGKLVGKTGDFPHNYMGYNEGERRYLVMLSDINLAGNNLIAIKFHDGWSGKGGFLPDAQLHILSATTNDKIQMTVEVADEDYIFMDGKPLEINVSIDNKNQWEVAGNLLVKLTTDDYQALQTDSLSISIHANKTEAKQITYHQPTPGFYRYTVQYTQQGELAGQEKLNVGYEPEKIQSPNDAQSDFRAFWDKVLGDLKKIAPRYQLTKVEEASQQDYDMYLVEMYSIDNELIQGYYAKPKKEGKHPIIVEYMGYGSKPYLPNQWWDGFAYFVLSIRGQALNQPTNKYGTWITHGLDDKNKYYYRGAFMDVVRALDFVSSRPEINAEQIAVRGGSQGGALSFAAAALDKRVKVAAPTIPFLSDYTDYFKITNWPRSDFDIYMKENPTAKWDDVYTLMSYFDIKNLAQWITCPLLMGIGVQDDVCPPHINFAAYNQVPSAKRWMAFPLFGHSVGKEFHDESMRFIKTEFGINE